MIQGLVTRFDAARPALLEKFSEKHPESYREILRALLDAVCTDWYGVPDPERIHEIDDGHYQGTLVFVIAEKGYQPGLYYYTLVDYGSCSGCDTLEGIRQYSDEKPTDEQAKEYLDLALHLFQGLREMGRDET